MSAMSTIIDIQVRANQVVTAVSNGTRAPVVFVMTLLEAMTATIPEMGVGVTVATAASCVLGGGYVRYQVSLDRVQHPAPHGGVPVVNYVPIVSKIDEGHFSRATGSQIQQQQQQNMGQIRRRSPTPSED